MRCRKATILLIAVALAGVSQASNLVVNGDFEQGVTGWTTWWGGNVNRNVADPVEGDRCAGVWWHDDGIYQDIAIGPGVYEFGGKLMTTQGMVNRRGVIQAEVGDGTNVWWTQQLDIVPGDAINVWHIAKPQAGFPNSAIIDNTVAGATRIRINLMMANTGTPPSGIVFYDDIYLGLRGISKKAKFPRPFIGELVAPATNVLRWIKPDPNKPADTITCNVYLAQGSGSLALIAGNITANSVTLSQLSPPIALLPGMPYNWRVDCRDPNSGGTPVTTQGDVWTFTTRNDNPPVVNAGPDRYLWINMADGDGDPTKVTFTLAGQLTDDGQSPVTLLWSLIYSEQDPATTVLIGNRGSLTTPVVINGTGLFRFRLDADDAYAHAEDIVDVIIYGSACEAAQGDPSDHYQTYAFLGDVNNDCLINMQDLAIMAATWLDCVSAKLGCTP